MEYREVLDIHKKAKKIVASDLSWSDKYSLIFSDEISGKFDFEWCDPDTDYDEDVYAFMTAFDEYILKARIIEEQINN